MNERFNRTTFESVDFQLENPEAPKIKAGASSSSNIFNRFFTAVSKDMSLLTTRTNILASRSARIENACTELGGALASQLSTLSTRVDVLSGYSYVLADMASQYYLDTLSSTNVEISNYFCQTTLEPLSTTDLLVQTDVYGNSYISPEVKFSYSTSSASSISDLNLTDFVLDSDGIYMLKQDQVWLKDTLGGQSKGYIRVKAPLQFRGLIPNVMEVYPFPPFAMKLRKASYREAGSAENVWTHLDLSYLVGYNPITQVVDLVGPVRLHLDNVPLSEIALEFDVSTTTVWGLKKLKLYHREYTSAGTLVVEDPFSRTIGDISLRGKDTMSLSSLSNQKSSNQVSISLSSTDSSTTPVITGVILSVS